jgi:uncharacterized protein
MSAQQTLNPTANSQRITSMDIIRGISLLGILLMNIVGFGLFKAYMDPTNSGGSSGWNLNVWWINSMFFEGTMRGMFSMLFGAGILLFTNRATENSNGTVVTDLFFRRLLWMLLFGIIHCYLLLWDGEILYGYAIVGMFAFSFRHLQQRTLIIGVTAFLLFTSAMNVKDYYQTRDSYESASAASLKKSKGEVLSKEENNAISAWEEKVRVDKATPEQLKEEMDARSKGYFSIVKHKGPENEYMQTVFLYRIGFFDVLAMMLLGMAFLKNGILTAEKSNRFYLIMALIGYTIGLTTNFFEARYLIANNFEILAMYKFMMTYHLGRIPTTMGHIAVIMLFVKSGWLPFLQKSFAAVGQMAFTNYIMQSIICNFIFLGYGFAMYGKLQRYELYYIVFSVWALQLILSPIWLRYFRFGPLEWLWRSLTYWKKQPMLRVAGESQLRKVPVPVTGE